MTAKPRRRTRARRRKRPAERGARVQRRRDRPWWRATQPSFVTIGLTTLLVVGAAYAWPLVRPGETPTPLPVSPSVPVTVPTPQAVPELSAAPAPRRTRAAGRTRPADAYAGWARGLSPTLDIPVVALQAYAYAQVTTARTDPGCKLSWTLLAGIGRIESNHGRYGGAQLRADGTSRPPIVGVPLDGAPGLMTISDTDGGRLDGDARYDRAVGPMQFIPSTWARSGADGDGDGRKNPFDIDDAATAAAGYLCAGGRDLTTSQGWTQAVLSYNRTAEYVRSVYAYADSYARQSLG